MDGSKPILRSVVHNTKLSIYVIIYARHFGSFNFFLISFLFSVKSHHIKNVKNKSKLRLVYDKIPGFSPLQGLDFIGGEGVEPEGKHGELVEDNDRGADPQDH